MTKLFQVANFLICIIDSLEENRSLTWTQALSLGILSCCYETQGHSCVFVFSSALEASRIYSRAQVFSLSPRPTRGFVFFRSCDRFSTCSFMMETHTRVSLLEVKSASSRISPFRFLSSLSGTPGSCSTLKTDSLIFLIFFLSFSLSLYFLFYFWEFLDSTL